LAPSEDEAVLALLGAVPDEELNRLGLDPFKTNSASGRLALLAMAAIEPLDRTGTPIDIPLALDEYGINAVTDLVPRRRSEVGARGFWPVPEPLPTGEESLSVLQSHGVTAESARLLRLGDYDGFVGTRTRNIEDLLRRFVSSRLEAKTRVRPSIASLVVPDEVLADHDD
jgi:hypothetical protein